MVAAGLLAAALLPLFLMQSTAIGRARTSKNSVGATALSCELAEQLRLVPFAGLPVTRPFEFRYTGAVATAGQVSLPGPPPVPLVVGAYPLDASVRIVVEPLDPPDVLARLTITVDWTEGQERAARSHRHVELIENRLGVRHED